jgi:hypothetical protein
VVVFDPRHRSTLYPRGRACHPSAL